MIYCGQTCDKNSKTSSENYPISIPIAPNKHNIYIKDTALIDKKIHSARRHPVCM